MVTFYRKAQINSFAANSDSTVDATPNLQSGRFNGSDYVGIISADDELPYVVVRPKSNRQTNGTKGANGKKVLRMRSSWD